MAPAQPGFDYRQAALKLGEMILDLRRMRSPAAYDQKLLADMENLYLALVRRAQWIMPASSKEPFPDLSEIDAEDGQGT